MTLKSAAFLATIGMILLSALALYDLVQNFIAIVRGLLPAARLFSSLIFAFSSVAVTIYFFVAYKRQA
ncbi:MAG TPA: hypothetical protein VKX49_00455 [Bryobacteraceae bacterium]|nr:hypothetical protein [Bryobacteraceae bacterium]